MKGKIRLRALTSNDIEKTLKWHNDDEIKYFYLGHPFPVNIEIEKKWYDEILTSDLPTTVFGIEKKDEAKLIGLSVLKNINLINREAEFAIYIGDLEERGKGYSKIATMLTLEFGFRSMGLNRIFLKVMEENKVAINLYKKCGFVEEGVLRKSIFKNNEFKNEVVMSILKDEFEKVAEKYEL